LAHLGSGGKTEVGYLGLGGWPYASTVVLRLFNCNSVVKGGPNNVEGRTRAVSNTFTTGDRRQAPGFFISPAVAQRKYETRVLLRVAECLSRTQTRMKEMKQAASLDNSPTQLSSKKLIAATGIDDMRVGAPPCGMAPWGNGEYSIVSHRYAKPLTNDN